jgi:hypothetical protein
VSVLEFAFEAFRRPLLADHFAQAGFYLALARLRLGDVRGARSTLDAARPGFQELAESGLRLLAGPQGAFYEVRSLLDDELPDLELRFLGGREASFKGRVIILPPRWSEILTVLAMRPDGVSGERLLLKVYGDAGRPANLKAPISKLRRTIPVISRPYRLKVSCRADFLELEKLMQEGRVREALALYHGPLLPASDAEGVVEARHMLEAGLRRAVLASGDVEALMDLANRLGDDLEVWEAALRAMPDTDPRYPLAWAHAEHLRRG